MKTRFINHSMLHTPTLHIIYHSMLYKHEYRLRSLTYEPRSLPHRPRSLAEFTETGRDRERPRSPGVEASADAETRICAPDGYHSGVRGSELE